MIRKVFAFLGMVCLAGLTACGSQNQETEVRETVNGFYSASQSGNYSAMRDYVTGGF